MKICKARIPSSWCSQSSALWSMNMYLKDLARFGGGDALTLEFDRMVGADGFQAFRKNLAQYIAPVEEFEMLEPVSYEITEAFGGH